MAVKRKYRLNLRNYGNLPVFIERAAVPEGSIVASIEGNS